MAYALLYLKLNQTILSDRLIMDPSLLQKVVDIRGKVVTLMTEVQYIKDSLVDRSLNNIKTKMVSVSEKLEAPSCWRCLCRNRHH